MPPVLEINNLSKSFGKIQAIDSLSLSVEEGNIYGILGPNGSGKTTTLGIILDVIAAKSGSYKWFGELPSRASRKRIGSFVEAPCFYPYLSASQNLDIISMIKKTDHMHINRALQTTGLFKRRNSKFQGYSLGMKQRLAIAAALLGNPDVLVLDEPTNGLDPKGIAEIRNLIIELGQQGKTIILASHLLDEVEKVCTHVAILKAGKLLAKGHVADVLADEDQIELASANLEALEKAIKEHNKFKSLTRMNDKLLVKFSEKANTDHLNKYLFEKGVTLSLLNLKKKSLENQFLELTEKDD